MDEEKNTENLTNVEPTPSELQNIEQTPASQSQNLATEVIEDETAKKDASENGGILVGDEEENIVWVFNIL